MKNNLNQKLMKSTLNLVEDNWTKLEHVAITKSLIKHIKSDKVLVNSLVEDLEMWLRDDISAFGYQGKNFTAILSSPTEVYCDCVGLGTLIFYARAFVELDDIPWTNAEEEPIDDSAKGNTYTFDRIMTYCVEIDENDPDKTTFYRNI